MKKSGNVRKFANTKFAINSCNGRYRYHMIDKSFFFFFYQGDKSLIKVYMCIFVSISICRALALVKVGRNVYVIYMYI